MILLHGWKLSNPKAEHGGNLAGSHQSRNLLPNPFEVNALLYVSMDIGQMRWHPLKIHRDIFDNEKH
jgi:hypothetical protein